MTNSKRIALIHATRLAIDPIVSTCQTLWPQVEPVSLLDESLAIDRCKNEHLTEELSSRIIALNQHAIGLGAHGVLFTCSAFGKAIEKAAATSAVPVLKPNEAMFEKAVSLGNRVVMIYTFPPAVAGMEQEFLDFAVHCGSAAGIQSVYAEGAREALEQGRLEEHNKIISHTVSQVKNADVILLAHFSMAIAESLAKRATHIPVLSSPATAVEKIKLLVEANTNTV